MYGKVLGRSAIVAAALMAVAPAQAATFLFTNSGSTPMSGSAGNSLTLTAGGLSLTAYAFSTATNGATSAAYLGYYGGQGGGLGVTNANEGNGANNGHTIDNRDGFDFVALSFNQAVRLDGLTKNNYAINGTTDGAFWVSYLNTVTKTFESGTNYASNASGASSAFSTVWLIGASRNSTARNDGFKLSSVTVTSQVPEVGTWLMMIGGFGLMGASLRRRRAPGALAAA